MTDEQTPKRRTTKPKDLEGISAAYVKAWAEIQAVAYDRANDHFKAKYATYDAIIGAVRPILADHGLAITQTPSNAYDDEGKPDPRAIITTTLVHISGETMDLGTIAVPAKKTNDPQAFGSAMTYAKRYALCAALCIPTGDDDDGNAAASTDYRKLAIDMIAEWSGVGGQDLNAAARDVAQRAGSTDPKQICEFVQANKHIPFAEFMVPNKNGVSK